MNTTGTFSSTQNTNLNTGSQQLAQEHYLSMPQTYALTRKTINEAAHLFDVHDTDRDGYIRFDQLPGLLAASFAVQNLPPPKQSDLTPLLNKYDKNNDQRLTKREFKRLLKELAGHKQYDTGVFSMEKIKQYFGMQPKEATQATDKSSKLGMAGLFGSQINVLGPQVPTPVAQTNINETQAFQVPQQPNVLTNPSINTPINPSGISTAKPVTNVETPTMKTTGTPQTNPTGQSHLTSFPLRNFPLSLDTIKHSRALFDQHDLNNDGYVDIYQLGDVIRAIYQAEGRHSPDSETISLLLAKYNFAKDRKINYWEFKRMLKELAGYKTYEKDNISLFKHQHHDMASTHPATHLHPPVTRTNMQNQNHPAYFVKVPDEDPQKTYPLSKEAIHDSKRIFETYDVNNTGYLSYGELENAVRDVYEKSGQTPPGQNDIAYLIQKYDKNQRNRLSFHEFKQLLNELAGIKSYTSTFFSYFKKLHF